MAPTLKYRIVDDEGNDVPWGSPGELLFRHANYAPFVVEYFGNSEASATKCAGGWLHMGDVVHEDENGWLVFDYRKGSDIRRNGDFIKGNGADPLDRLRKVAVAIHILSK